MPDPAHPFCSLDPTQVERLACPVCLGKLGLEPAVLVCLSCGRRYPVLDGIPVLIAERAQPAG